MTVRREFPILKLAAIAGICVALAGCQGFREAAGVAKTAPDEFTVLTKAPLIIPPDYNLRPPLPGTPDRNMGTPDEEARNALFQQDPDTAAANLEGAYSPGERALLANTGASVANPDIRRAISADAGLADQGDAFANEVLFPDEAAAAPAAAPADTAAAQ